ncbi:MAG: DUF58 domain-containing protein [Spirochaetes bacterium]|nr:MAG: DUF58 domain-containing protein [Spirochaetota bacterium]
MNNLELFSKIKNLPLVSSRLVDGFLSGNYRSVFKGPGLEFDEVREYAEGDDARFIDWNVTSRIGTPYTKTFREEREIVLFLVVDVSASLQSGSGTFTKQDTAAILSSLLAFSAVHNNDKVGAVFFSDRIEKWVPPMKGKKQVFRLIEDMMNIEAEGKGSDLKMAIRTVYESLNRRGICIILSDFRTPPCWKELSLLGKKHDLIALKITDPSDLDFPLSGLVELVDPETGATIYGSGRSGKFRREYREFWETNDIFWKRECRRRGISHLEISTVDDPVLKLLNFFSRRKRR